MKYIAFASFALFAWFAASSPSLGEDWPAYRHDARRSGASGEKVAMPLTLQWTHRPAFGPRAGWEAPHARPIEDTQEWQRVAFDDAPQTVAAGGIVCFGSSGENKVVALDPATGRTTWTFYTEAPVRLAPTIAGGKVYFGSDDGTVHCLDAPTGREVWNFHAAPAREMILGNGTLISRWPVRTGVLVEGGTAYFGAGVFPAEGLYLYAVGAGDGKTIWTNDTYGRGGLANLSPQGYLLASRDRLFLPTGRTMPAAFSRGDGRFLFQRDFFRAEHGLTGGTYDLLDGDVLIAAGEQVVGVRQRDGALAYDEGRQQRNDSTGPRRLALTDGAIFLLTGRDALAVERGNWVKALRAVATADVFREHAGSLQRALDANPADRQSVEKLLADARGNGRAAEEQLTRLCRWRVATTATGEVIAAANAVFVGGKNEVFALDAATGGRLWSAPVKGLARGLTLADGRLLVSTDAGEVACFAAGAAPAAPAAAPTPEAAGDGLAESLIQAGAPTRGYALVLGGRWQDAAGLARRSDLQVYLTSTDPQAARAALDTARLHGGRVSVLESDLKALPCPDYFANLVVVPDPAATPAAEVARMVKPCGGMVFVRGDASAVAAELTKVSARPVGVRRAGDWAVAVRGPLVGAGGWTHQNGDAGGTGCSGDRLVGGPLRTLWFGLPGAGTVPNRHAGAASPLCEGGVMFVPTVDGLAAYDAYNGLALWRRAMPELDVLHGQPYTLAAGEGGLFAVVGGQCHRLDAATGATAATYALPGEGKGVWNFVACAGGVLYGAGGSAASARQIFAYNLQDARLLWRHETPDAAPYSICLDGGRLFYFDRTVSPEQVAKAARDAGHKTALDKSGRPIPPDVRMIVALDARTGKEAWRKPQYVSDCITIGQKDSRGRPIGVFGDLAGGDLTMMAARGVLLLAGQPWNGHFWTAFFTGKFDRRSLIALSADDGHTLWAEHKLYRSRPLILGDRIIAEPWAHDLKTGRQVMRTDPVTGRPTPWQMARPGHHCGPLAASARMLFFRSGVVGAYDLEADYGTTHFAAKRPACRISCIAADGLALWPEGSAGCTCPFSLQGTVVMKPSRASRAWGFYSSAAPLTPVKHLALHLGAPGDRRDEAGTLWLAFPRPKLNLIPTLVFSDKLVLNFPLNLQPAKAIGYFTANPDRAGRFAAGPAVLASSGCTGLTRLTVPLGQAAARYTVRLTFADPQHARAGQRVFHVLLQDRKVADSLDVAALASAPGAPVVKEFKGIEAAGDLSISFQPLQGQPTLSGLEVIAETP